ncbi:hypothetical protein EON64_09090 [archaeon]|nr:MAG: hypothetical protein EON64_09090 [archaeon]
MQEIEEVNLHPPEGSVIRSFGGSPVNCEFDVEVGAETVHYVRIKVTFREGHPYFCPAIEVLTRIASPNVLMQLDGRGRVLHIEEVWSAAWSLRQLAEHLRALLACPDLSLLPDRYAGIVQDWQRGIQRLQAAEKREPEAAADPSDSKDRGEEGAAEPSGAQRDVGAQAEQGDVLKEPQDQKEQQVENSEFPGEDAERPEAKPLSLEAISSAGTLSRIQAMSRVEQLHVSQLFLFVTDRAAHQAFALWR